jgi:PAS domain S-box-containing protein
MSKEQLFTESEILLSITDLNSRIKYANKNFCNISGYQFEEMQGKPHNMVRHSDMPKEAFSDLWQFIQSGKSWMGPVKNCCKNGDYYWVNAFVTPIKDKNGKISEYQSIRTKPEREVVERATQVYQQLKANNKPFALTFTTDMTLWFQTIFMMFIIIFGLCIAFTEVSLLFTVPMLSLSVVSAVLFSSWRKKYRALIVDAKAVFDNSFMSYIYSGNNDDIGAVNLALKMRKAQVNAIVGRVSDVSDNTTHTANQSAKRGSEVTNILSQQKIETEQVATAINEMSATVQDIARVVTQAAVISKQGLEITNDGQKVVLQTINSINVLSEQLEEVNRSINRLITSSNSIGAVLSEINSIADQTNLLALNAAIEAARAGEQGRGFAVVADEVRALALRTQQSTEEIKKLLVNLQAESTSAVISMEKGTTLSIKCVNLASQTGDSLVKINKEVSELANINDQIATAVEEQSVVTEQVNKSIISISDMSLQSEQFSNQAAMLSNDLLSQIQDQQVLVVQFRG